MSLFALNASAAIYDGGLDNVTNGPMVASVSVTVCAEQPSGEDGIIVTVLHYSPSVGWTNYGDFSWYFSSVGCYERSGVYWPFPSGTMHVSAKLASGGPSYYLGYWVIP
jgi:hypothetical protein